MYIVLFPVAAPDYFLLGWGGSLANCMHGNEMIVVDS